MDNGPNCHENLSESNSPSEKNVNNNKNQKDYNNENLSSYGQIREVPIDIQVSEDYIDDGNEKGESLEESQESDNNSQWQDYVENQNHRKSLADIANTKDQNQPNVPIEQTSNQDKSSDDKTKINKPNQKACTKKRRNNRSKEVQETKKFLNSLKFHEGNAFNATSATSIIQNEISRAI